MLFKTIMVLVTMWLEIKLLIEQMNDRNNILKENSLSLSSVMNHNGIGDNVAGDKTVINQSISTSQLHTPIRDVLSLLRHRCPSLATEKLGTLSSTASLNDEARNMLDVLRILIRIVDLGDSDFPQNSYQQLSVFVKSSGDKLCVDIAISAQLRLAEKNKRQSDANGRSLHTLNVIFIVRPGIGRIF